MGKKNVMVLFGGCSCEYEVSLQSSFSVIENMDKNKFTPILVGITKSGDWYHFIGDIEKIAADTWLSAAECRKALLSPNRSLNELVVLHDSSIETIAIDVVFPVLHGKNGEDGTVQGMCQLAGIPVVGCGTLACAVCMDKDQAHKLVSLAGIRVPRSFVLTRDFDESHALSHAKAIGYPLFIKPVKAGSSYGITKVTQASRLLKAIYNAFEYDDQVVAEETIDGFEVGCAVMGNRTLITGEIDEIELENGFFDFTEKYNLLTSSIHIPARISQEKAREVKCAAKKIYRALNCSGLARVDMFLTPAGEIVFNEVNTMPGFTAHSRFPNMIKAVGMSFEQLITHAIELAVDS